MNANGDGDPDRSFRFEYRPGALRFGSGSVADLDRELERRGLDRALVVCGSTVGETPAVVDPIRRGLGDGLVGVFAETTPEKRLETAYRGLDRFRAEDADAIVGVGGGSSLDVAKVVSVLAAADRPPADVGAELVETGTITVPDADLPPIVAVPTTLSGADLSMAAGVTAAPDSGLVGEAADGGIADPKLMPAAIVYDPELFATTPRSILAASAMNGFDKAVETAYARNASPITDATATRALGKLRAGLQDFGDGDDSVATLETIVEGIVLAQYGVSRPDGSALSIVHAFGHGLTRTYDVQQGAVHGIVAPHVLSYLFDRVDGRRELLAEGLRVADADDHAAAVVDAVTEVRDALDLPDRLRDVKGPEPPEFTAVAEAVLDDSLMANAPPGLDPTVEDVEAVLQDAW